MRLFQTVPSAILFLIAAACGGNDSGTGSASSATLVIDGAAVIDGTGAAPIENGRIVIAGERIVAVGPREAVEAPEGAEVIDAAGKWVTPGLIDAHVHFFQTGSIFTRPDGGRVFNDIKPYEQEIAYAEAHVDDYFKRYLASGVTTVVDAGGPLWNFDVRDAARSEDAAPRVAVAGPLVKTISDETYDTSVLWKPDDPAIIYAATPEDARDIVRMQLPRKPDLIKTWYVISDEQPAAETFEVVKAAAEEAHAAGVRFAVHATQLETAKLALRAGADVLVHSVGDAPVDDEFIELLKANDAVYTTTLMVSEGYVEAFGGAPALLPIEARLGDPEVIDSWSRTPPEIRERYQANAARVAESLDIGKRNLKTLIDAGVAVAAGTDAGNPGTLHGPAIHREIELLSSAGLTPMEVIVAATRDAAHVFSAEPEIGVIEAGKFADLLLLDADPLADTANLQAVKTVFKGGKPFDPKELVPSQE